MAANLFMASSSRDNAGFDQRAPPGIIQSVLNLGGLEPPTCPISGVRSNHLSYSPPGPLTLGLAQGPVNRHPTPD